MDYINTQLKWEDFFIQENIELEEKMSSLDIESLSKSKIRLALENNILPWEKYEDWVLTGLGCSSLSEKLNENTLKNFTDNAKQAFDIYSNYDFWGEDLLPLFIWENQVVVIGLQYNENLVQIKDHIFLLCPPNILSFFAKVVFQKNSDSELEMLEKSLSQTISRIEGLELDASIKPPKLDFSELKMDTITNFEIPIEEPKKSKARILDPNEPPAAPQVLSPPPPIPVLNAVPSIGTPQGIQNVWEFMSERFEEYNFEMKKNFSAFMILKINSSKLTEVFKMDPDLEKEQVNTKLFEYDLKTDNPFSNVFDSGVSESFSVSRLSLHISDFKYICITALKEGPDVVGFLVGFKNSHLSENDQSLLEELARESAAAAA